VSYSIGFRVAKARQIQPDFELSLSTQGLTQILSVKIMTAYFFLFLEALKMLLLTLGKKFNF